ncbi:hypothetical protein HOY80DRAFT_1059896 [Tuber brumale]|nr:hypothetical protein HOY80DRAFT_1059896 [Tuber brumale]
MPVSLSRFYRTSGSHKLRHECALPLRHPRRPDQPGHHELALSFIIIKYRPVAASRTLRSELFELSILFSASMHITISTIITDNWYSDILSSMNYISSRGD